MRQPISIVLSHPVCDNFWQQHWATNISRLPLFQGRNHQKSSVIKSGRGSGLSKKKTPSFFHRQPSITILSGSVSKSYHNREPQTRWLKRQDKNLFFTIPEARSSKARCQQDRSFLKLLPLACNVCLLLVSSHGLPSLSICVLISPSYKDIIYI